MDIEALVRKGRNKERCEDKCLNGRSVLCDIDGRCSIDGAFIAAVADGVGGNQLGDVAASSYSLSSIRLYTTCRWFMKSCRWPRSFMLSCSNCSSASSSISMRTVVF